MKLKAIILEDEEGAMESLENMVQTFTPEVQIVAGANDLKNFSPLMAKYKPDFIFLDLEIKGSSGFEIFEQKQKFAFQTVITTAHEQFALKSYEFDICDYLVKPIKPSDLKRAVEKVKKTVFGQADPLVMLSTLDGIIPVKAREIIRFEAYGNYTWIVLENGNRPVLSSKNLGYFENLLKGKAFIRVHQTHLVAQDQIVSFHKSTSMVELKNGDQVAVSRERKKYFIHGTG